MFTTSSNVAFNGIVYSPDLSLVSSLSSFTLSTKSCALSQSPASESISPILETAVPLGIFTLTLSSLIKLIVIGYETLSTYIEQGARGLTKTKDITFITEVTNDYKYARYNISNNGKSLISFILSREESEK